MTLSAHKQSHHERHAAIQSLFSEAHDASSFGPIGHIAPVSAGRLKGFIGPTGRQGEIAVVSTDEQIQFMGEVVQEGISRLGGELTRLSLRMVLSDEGGENIVMGRQELLRREVARHGAKIEAFVPTTGGTIVYVGYNTSDRGEHVGDPTEARNAFLQNRDTALTKAARDIVDHGAAYTILPILEGDVGRVFKADQMNQIHRLLGVFNGNNYGASVESVLNPDNIIGLVQHKETGAIVGISVVEIRRIPLSNGDTIILAELTDGKVTSPHGDRSLYARVVNEMFRTIATNHRDIDVVFAESNLSNAHLLEVAGMQGRHNGGILDAHAKISDPRTDTSNLKSFMVTYLDLHEVGPSVQKLDSEVALRSTLRD